MAQIYVLDIKIATDIEPLSRSSYWSCFQNVWVCCCFTFPDLRPKMCFSIVLFSDIAFCVSQGGELLVVADLGFKSHVQGTEVFHWAPGDKWCNELGGKGACGNRGWREWHGVHLYLCVHVCVWPGKRMDERRGLCAQIDVPLWCVVSVQFWCMKANERERESCHHKSWIIPLWSEKKKN